MKVAFHLELMYDKHDRALAVSRVNVPFTRPVSEVFVRVIGRLDNAAASRDVLYAPCTPASVSRLRCLCDILHSFFSA